MHFMVFNVQNGDILGVAEISDIFCGMPDIPDILGVKSSCWFQAYT